MIRIFLVSLSLLAYAPKALAKDLASAVIQAVFEALELDEKKIISKSRRMTSLGPWVGGTAAWDTTRGSVDGHAQLGLGLFLFSDPVLDLGELKERIQARVLARLTNGNYDTSDRDRLVQELLQDMKKEFQAVFNEPPSSWPKALFALSGEVGLAFQPTVGNQLRFGLGIGISRFTLGPSIAFNFGDDYSFLVGPELATSILVGTGPRPVLINLFGRYEFRYLSYTRDNSLTFGVRLLLDLL